MPNWRDEYLSSLRESELNSPVNMELVQACSQMADRISSLEAEKLALEAHIAGLGNNRSKSPSLQPSEAAANDPGVAQLRLDLAEALRSRGVAETRLRTAEEELEKLRSKTKQDSKAIRDLTGERTTLATKVNDREYELREKRKLVENVQDEMIALNLQLSMAEKERDRLKKENSELIDRWMKRMGQEADAMNLANEPTLGKGR
ncbi:autophagy protein 16 (ATG16) domain-containing protein [Trichoderma breve]|uniref:Autophagy protein 16 (ATG16) domain-containing protein n=1 Tax=Trichoderma breve TaxID=2034170 RepID=A0A9W9B3I4_9HYPO|nr:autophagy protein 16 (ATG16) domain-containing protein [Trichoderma breve]KAJ4855308.1 autophagy protein 16 (ATG16) domain-containing protein [Trichoderma breve]